MTARPHRVPRPAPLACAAGAAVALLASACGDGNAARRPSHVEAQVSEQIAHDSFPTRLDGHDEEERGGGERGENCLGFLEANW